MNMRTLAVLGVLAVAGALVAVFLTSAGQTLPTEPAPTEASAAPIVDNDAGTAVVAVPDAQVTTDSGVTDAGTVAIATDAPVVTLDAPTSPTSPTVTLDVTDTQTSVVPAAHDIVPVAVPALSLPPPPAPATKAEKRHRKRKLVAAYRIGEAKPDPRAMLNAGRMVVEQRDILVRARRMETSLKRKELKDEPGHTEASEGTPEED